MFLWTTKGVIPH